LLADFVVNSTGDEPDFDLSDGIANIGVPDPLKPGMLKPADPPITTFRAAIQQANASPGADTIGFVVSRIVSASFPPIEEQTQIAGGIDKVELLGSPLIIKGSNSVVRGLVLEGLNLEADGCRVEGSHIGVDGSGTMAGGGGMTVSSSDNVIGGTTPERRNVIGSTDRGFALVIDGHRNRVIGNYIGVTADGNAPLVAIDQSYGGINIFAGSDNVIGGTEAGAGNVISGFTGWQGIGIGIESSFTRSPVRNVIQGNRIGTNRSGTAAIPNNYGIFVRNAEGMENNIIGGASPGAGNVISGNNDVGIVVKWSDNIVIQGNLIGVGGNGRDALGNGGLGSIRAGIYVLQDSQHIAIGGVEPGQGNTIAFNAGGGVVIATPARNNPIRGNRIFGNGGLGIDLEPLGVTPNDVGSNPPDADGGPNLTQNFPVLTLDELGTGLAVTLESTPSQEFKIDVYSNEPANVDPSGFGEGQEYVGTLTLFTDDDGKAEAFAPFLIPADRRISATATDPFGNTSEFSRIAAFPGFVVNSTRDAPDSQLDDGRCGTGVTLPNGELECTLRAAIMQTNRTPTRELITFAIPGAGPHTIQIDAACAGTDCGLPTIVQPLVINGFTQPGARPGDKTNPAVWQILLKPSDVNAASPGLRIAANDVSIRGLSIEEFNGAGILVRTGSENLLEQNRIIRNKGPGIAIESGSENRLRNNSIFENDGIGIDLGNDGVTPNDPHAADIGPNRGQRSPTIHLLERDLLGTAIVGSLAASPNRASCIDFYATDSRNSQRLERGLQGERHIGTIELSAEATGFIHFRADLPRTESYEVITATVTDEDGSTSEFSHFTPDFIGRPASGSVVSEFRTPVVIVPGFFGSMPDALPGIGDQALYTAWLKSHGVAPATLSLDPILRGYDDLVRTLKKAGYVEGLDLWRAPYDWRLPIAPSSLPGHGRDGIADGLIQGVTAETIVDEVFNYSLDYLGWWLAQVAEIWYAVHRQPLTTVHLISHSMGGLLSRAYIQSSAYGGRFHSTLGVDLHLPLVASLTMFGVPNQGSPVVFPAWYDDFSPDISYVLVLSKVINHAWDKMQSGTPISIREGETTTLLSREDARFVGKTEVEQKVAFARAYVPGMRDLQPSYPGVNEGGFPLDPGSFLLEDLNQRSANGELQLGARVARAMALYGVDVETSNTLQRRVGPDYTYVRDEWGEPRMSPKATVVPFSHIEARVPQADEVWFKDIRKPAQGDGTVPLPSLRLFADDPLVAGFEYCNEACGANQRSNGDGVAHTELPYNRDAQALVLRNLGHPISEDQISYLMFAGTMSGLRTAWRFSTYTVVNDPVQSLLVDADGRRLGWTEATGAVSEIPGSVYLGGQDGIGWILPTESPGPGPLTLQLTGLDSEYGVQVAGYQANVVAGIKRHGYLASGETATFDVPQAQFVYTADLDGSGAADALTDGVLLRRYLAGLRGDGLVANALAPDARYLSGGTVAQYMSSATLALFDVDANGKVESETDGKLVQRFMVGFQGQGLIDGLIDPAGSRTDVAEIARYLRETLVPTIALPPADAKNRQILRSDFDGGPVEPEQPVSITFSYQASVSDAVATGLAFRLHYDSRRLRFDGLTNLAGEGFVQQQVLADSLNDLDDDPRTDKYVLLFWCNAGAPWPTDGPLPFPLVTAMFTTLPRFPGTTIHLTGAAVSPGYALDASSLTLPSTQTPDTWWQNPVDPFDVNEDGEVAPVDVLLVINELNSRKYVDAMGKLPPARPPEAFCYDVNGDGYAEPLDVLLIINFLNKQGGLAGESAATDREPLPEAGAETPLWMPATPAAPPAPRRSVADTQRGLESSDEDNRGGSPTEVGRWPPLTGSGQDRIATFPRWVRPEAATDNWETMLETILDDIAPWLRIFS